MQYEITNLSDSEDEFKPDPETITKIDYNGFPYENMYSRHVGVYMPVILYVKVIISLVNYYHFYVFMKDNGASSSGSNIRSSLLGMGFPPDLVDKAIRQNGKYIMN